MRVLGRVAFSGACAVGVFAAFSFLIRLVNEEVPEPYMDEVFHVAQTAAYCEGRWDYWDPKITTPPGLYYAALAVLSPPSIFLTEREGRLLCSSPAVLRSLNALYAAATFLLLYVLAKGRGQLSDTDAAMTAANLLSFPLLLFPSLLYYTDLLSLLSVLLMYQLAVSRLAVLSALAGLAAVFLRQSNVVWVAFAAGISAELILNDFLAAQAPDKQPKGLGSLSQTLGRLFRTIERRPMLGLDLCGRLFSRLSSFAFVGLGFAIFAVSNGGLALGDKGAHTVVFHLPQLYYFLAFSAAFGAPILLSAKGIADLMNFGRRHWVFCSLLGLSMAAGVAGWSYDHPYLLADNRHFTFYIWKNWFRRLGLLGGLVLVPGYVAALGLLRQSLGEQSPIWRLGFLVCVALATIPNRLLEFRYFLIPFVLWRLHAAKSTPARLRLEFLLFNAVNAATIYLFLAHPFTWASEPGRLQRFMW